MIARLYLTTTCLLACCTLAAQKNYPLLKFSEITANAPDTFRLKGVIKDTYKCPPCPPGAQCKPCIGDHILIAGSKNKNEAVRIFTDHPTAFRKDKAYTFIVRMGNRSHPLDFLQLLPDSKKKKDSE